MSTAYTDQRIPRILVSEFHNGRLNILKVEREGIMVSREQNCK